MFSNTKAVHPPENQKRLLYYILLMALAWLYAYYVPFLLDYYVVRPEESFFSFLHGSILSPIYEFESTVILLSLGVLYCITMKGWLSVLLLSCPLFVLSYGGYIKYLNRRELLRLDDLRLTEVAGMAMHVVSFEFSTHLLILAGGLLLFAAAGFALERLRGKKSDREPKLKRWRLLIRCGAGLALCILSACYTHYYLNSQLSSESVEKTDFARVETNRYVLYQFLFNENVSAIGPENIEESYAYLFQLSDAMASDQEAAAGTAGTADVIGKAGTSGKTVRPNVIVIMNESWWDTDNIASDAVTFSRDPMEPYRNLASKCTTGHLTSNVYGGGTVSSEAEFLTGLNTKYCASASSVYATTMNRKLPSVVDYFTALNYETVAIHPYYGNIYGRDTVYGNLGFGTMIFDEDMDYREIYSRYISDNALADQIIAEFKNRKDPRFIWALSIANHKRILDYSVDSIEDYDYPITVDAGAALSGEDYDTLVNYVNGIYLASLSFARLVEYFEGTDEPVVLVMYGDHIPNFSAETLELLGLSMEDAAPEMLERLYSVPIILWSNCSDKEISFTGESIWYLPWMLLDYAKLPDTRMSRMLAYERTWFKTNAREIVTDAEGNPIVRYSAEQMETMRHFQAINYDIMYGQKLYPNLWEPIEPQQ